jgi:transposase
LKRYKLVIVGDRKFHSIELAQWLHRQHLSFVLRQKCTTTFRQKIQPFQALDTIAIKPGLHLLYEKIFSIIKNVFIALTWLHQVRENIEAKKKMNLGIC